MANTFKFGNGQWATQEGLALAYNDENDNYKPLPFDFTRASTATRVNKQGLIETVASGLPRIDYLNNTNGALLLEPSSTNLVDNSANFFSGSWSGTRVNEGSTILAPNGNDEAHKLIATSVNNTHYREYTLSSASAGTYTGSCFFKKGEYDVGVIRMSVDSYANRYSIYINLNDGTFLRDATVGSPTGTAYKIEYYGSGWYKLSVTITHTSGQVRMSVSTAPSNYVNSNGLPVFLGNNSDGGYAWGGQVEVQSYSTSYIPTSGSAVTRAAETCNNAGNDQVINSTEGVLYAEVNPPVADVNSKEIQINSGSSADMVRIQFRVGGNIRFYVFANTSLVFLISASGIDYASPLKVAVAYKSGASKLYINGTQSGATNTTTYTFSSSLSTLTLDPIGGGDLYGNVKDLRLYNTALTDQELQALTS